jgi:hypothetical protein
MYGEYERSDKYDLYSTRRYDRHHAPYFPDDSVKADDASNKGVNTFLLVLVGLFFVLPILIGLLLPVIGRLLLSALSLLIVKLGTTSVAVLGAASVLPVGFIFFTLRRRYRPLYGGIEIVFGIALAYYTISKIVGDTATLLTLPPSQLIAPVVALMSSLYITVRGLDNIEQHARKIGLTRKLFKAVEAGNEDDVRRLLEAGANPNACKSKVTAVALAAKKGHAGIVKRLLSHGALVYRNKFGYETAYRFTFEKDLLDPETIQLIREAAKREMEKLF